MARSLTQRHKKMNGAVAPAKILEGQQSSKSQESRPTDTTSKKTRIKTCPNCDYTATKLADIRSHFAACVEVNGTPIGGCKDGDLTFVPRSHPVKRNFDDDLDDNANTDTPSTAKRTARAPKKPRTAEQRAERQRRFHERLGAVNGVVIPSKLAPGQSPIKNVLETGGRRTCQCSICGSMHNSHYHVQSHFATCVRINGNPNGARWNDAWNGTAFRTDLVSAQVSPEPQDDEMQDLQPNEYDLASLRLYDSGMEDASVDDHQYSKTHPAFSPSDDFESYHSNLRRMDSQPMFSSYNSPEHHPDLKYFDPLSPSSDGSGPYHPDVENLDTQTSSPDELPPYNSFPRMDGDNSLPRIETLAKQVLGPMVQK